MPRFVPFSVATALYGASVIVTTMTLLLAGVPAAPCERWRGLGTSAPQSCLIWLIGPMLMNIPAALATLGFRAWRPPVQELEALAVLSVRRACGFGALAIATLMLSLVGTPAAAFGTGAVCCLLMALILYWKGDHAMRQDHRKTELWLMLAESHRPPQEIAAVVVPRILRRIYLEHCRLALSVAAGLALPAFGLHLVA